MIKSLTIYRLAGSPEEFNKLSAFLKGLGFEPGDGWSDEYSRGAPHLAAVGSLEIVAGRLPAEPDVLVEVNDIDTACKLARDRKSTRLNSSHLGISYAVFCLK